MNTLWLTFYIQYNFPYRNNSWFLFIAKQESMTQIYHSLFNHLTLERCVGCCQFRAIVNKAAINIQAQFLCGHNYSFLWNKCPGVKLLGHMLVVHLFSKKWLSCFPRQPYHFIFPTAVYEISVFLHPVQYLML